MFGVMCCDCGGFLGLNGETVIATGMSEREFTFVMQGRVIHMPPWDVTASGSREEIEALAQKAGWTVRRTATGEPDHRCAACGEKENAERKRVGHHPGKEAGAKRGLLVPIPR